MTNFGSNMVNEPVDMYGRTNPMNSYVNVTDANGETFNMTHDQANRLFAYSQEDMNKKTAVKLEMKNVSTAVSGTFINEMLKAQPDLQQYIGHYQEVIKNAQRHMGMYVSPNDAIATPITPSGLSDLWVAYRELQMTLRENGRNAKLYLAGEVINSVMSDVGVLDSMLNEGLITPDQRALILEVTKDQNVPLDFALLQYGASLDVGMMLLHALSGDTKPTYNPEKLTRELMEALAVGNNKKEIEKNMLDILALHGIVGMNEKENFMRSAHEFDIDQYIMTLALMPENMWRPSDMPYIDMVNAYKTTGQLPSGRSGNLPFNNNPNNVQTGAPLTGQYGVNALGQMTVNGIPTTISEDVQRQNDINAGINPYIPKNGLPTSININSKADLYKATGPQIQGNNINQNRFTNNNINGGNTVTYGNFGNNGAFPVNTYGGGVSGLSAYGTMPAQPIMGNPNMVNNGGNYFGAMSGNMGGMLGYSNNVTGEFTTPSAPVNQFGLFEYQPQPMMTNSVMNMTQNSPIVADFLVPYQVVSNGVQVGNMLLDFDGRSKLQLSVNANTLSSTDRTVTDLAILSFMVSDYGQMDTSTNSRLLRLDDPNRQANTEIVSEYLYKARKQQLTGKTVMAGVYDQNQVNQILATGGMNNAPMSGGLGTMNNNVPFSPQPFDPVEVGKQFANPGPDFNIMGSYNNNFNLNGGLPVDNFGGNNMMGGLGTENGVGNMFINPNSGYQQPMNNGFPNTGFTASNANPNGYYNFNNNKNQNPNLGFGGRITLPGWK